MLLLLCIRFWTMIILNFHLHFLFFSYFLSLLLIDIEAESHHALIFLLVMSVSIIWEGSSVPLWVGEDQSWFTFDAFNGFRHYLEL